MEIVSSVFGDKINFENYKSHVFNDFSEHKNKLSASQIRESRKMNPNPIPNDRYTKEEVKKTKGLKL